MKRDLIAIRGAVVEAERVYESARGDYVVCMYRGRVYYVKLDATHAIDELRTEQEGASNARQDCVSA